MSNEAEMKRAREMAAACYAGIVELVERLRKADEADERDEDERDEARQAIHDDALSIQVRTGWYSPGDDRSEIEPEEYEILLCTGGPAVRIVGTLDRGEPSSAEIEYQDWFTPWTEWRGPDLPENYDEDVLLDYARTFWFGE